jgi:hypothetical protein
MGVQVCLTYFLRHCARQTSILQARSLEVHRFLGTLDGVPVSHNGLTLHIHETGAGAEVKSTAEIAKGRPGTPAFPYVSLFSQSRYFAELPL